LFVYRTQRGAKDWSSTRSVQGQTSIKRYFYSPSFSCISLYRFERKSVSTLSIFCLRVRVKLFEAIYLSAGRFSYNNPVRCVSFWFTGRANSFRGFVGNPNIHEPWVNKLRKEIRESNQQMVLLSLVGTGED
jgi:hypothetical protein